MDAPLKENAFMRGNSDDGSERVPSTANPLFHQSGAASSGFSLGSDDHDVRMDSITSESSAMDGEWICDHASRYDFCIVFPAKNGQLDPNKGESYVRKLRKLGFEVYIYKNISPEKEIYALLRVPLEKLRAFADQKDFPILLDAQVVERALAEGDAEHGIAPVEISHMPEVTHYRPCEKIYGKYSRQVDERLYFHEGGEEHPFREQIRLKLSAMLLETRPNDKEENLKLRRYLRQKTILACFPLHNREKTHNIEQKWNLYPGQALPLHDMKEYFGEKIALYFAFMEHYTSFLSVPAFIGLPFQLAVFITGDYSAPYLPFFSFFISLWAVTMLEFWKRKESTIALDWGTSNFEDQEVDRSDFKGKTIKSFIDGSEIRYFPSKTRKSYIYQSLLAIGALILLVTGIVVSIYVLRYAVVNYVGDGNAQTIASIANAVQIQVMNFVYSFLANALSERENHRTDTQFEDSMITKIFLFQFVNSYASFFYLAFVARWIEGGCSGDCMESLSINLAIIYGTRLVVGNLTELLVPYLTFQFKYRYEMLVHGGKMSRPEKEFRLVPYDLLSSSLEDYAEVAIQYGYTAMFVTALPMAAFFALISNVAEIRGDGWKLFNLHQRPIPKAAQDIGTWQTIFLVITIIAVITNAALTVFTMDALDGYSEVFRYWIFILFQWVCFALQAFIMAIIPDVPEEIEIQMQRTEFIVSKLIDKVADDDNTDVPGSDAPIVFETYPVDVGGMYRKKSHFLTESMK